MRQAKTVRDGERVGREGLKEREEVRGDRGNEKQRQIAGWGGRKSDDFKIEKTKSREGLRM